MSKKSDAKAAAEWQAKYDAWVAARVKAAGGK